MIRERVLKVVLMLVGLLFVAAVYPIAMYLRQPGHEPPGDYMMLSLYFTLGVFLLLAVRNPSAHRSLIAYAGWANIAHAAVMAGMAIHPAASDRRGLLIAAAGFSPIGIILLVLVPAKEPGHGCDRGAANRIPVLDSAPTQRASGQISTREKDL